MLQSTFKPLTNAVSQYPCLKEANGTVVLFTGPKTGTVLCCRGVPGGYYIGQHRENYWDEDSYKLVSSVTIYNKVVDV